MRTAELLCVFVIITIVNAKEKGESCVTPNDEIATCLPIRECSIILNAIRTRNSSSIDFARKSQCGYDAQPLVCCGTSAVSTSTASIPNHVNVLPDTNICGFDNSDRLIGGRIAQIGEFPWIAALEYEEKGNKLNAGIRCGGSVISNRYVLTAAHCIRTASYHIIKVWLGESTISTDPDCIEYISECADPIKKYNIEELISHPHYNPTTYENDIGLLRLENDTQFTDFIQPLCLPTIDYTHLSFRRLTVSGWGAMENGTNSDVKLKADVTLVSNDLCMNKRNSIRPLAPNQLCVGNENISGSCWGDSGGPVLERYYINKHKKDVRWYQEGVISWSTACDHAVYTPVSAYMDWITDTIIKSQDKD